MLCDAKGTLQWREEWDEALFFAPVEAGDLLVLGGASGEVRAVGLACGETRWAVELPDADMLVGLQAQASGLFAQTAEARLIVLDPEEGRTRWQVASEEGPVHPAVFVADRVGLVSEGGELRVFDAATGSLLWKQMLDQRVDTPPAADASAFFILANDDMLYAFEAQQGAARPPISLAALRPGTIEAKAGKLWVKGVDGRTFSIPILDGS